MELVTSSSSGISSKFFGLEIHRTKGARSYPHRQEPAVIEKFEEIWGTKELLVSFGTFRGLQTEPQSNAPSVDGVSTFIPTPRDASDKVRQPWAHVDQSPLVKDLYCVQGVVNLLPNGPDDGGLMLLKGSCALYSDLFNDFEKAGKVPEGGWNKKDRHDHSPEQVDWLKERGCEWIKICCEPGDLLLWDSVRCFQAYL
jgi:hypothetical protein